MNTETRIAQKIFKLSPLAEQCNIWRSQRQKIVFTNGCFDILHIGHIHNLQTAADQGDKLIVAINSDASVRVLKGENRPINTQENRAMILASLAYVAAVVIFDAPTPLQCIEALTPDVLVKGGDYTKNNIVGAQWVEQHGGRVLIIPFIHQISTTQLINQMQNKEKE
ncbi:MAG: D-glycero-beta-D-manno-heptose 1-phosphate adenylyltransferase [Chitinophagales bacterium]|nr:D-glycero-beta-D-manno-heptose 1-phosphate adenylyltransferase [Bacteroidota bacterium]MCB9042431.1 D-glycero-beta-D-manno-heptose 1-phosphate adenylyltransferase [Chitinophagales bacterium]